MEVSILELGLVLLAAAIVFLVIFCVLRCQQRSQVQTLALNTEAEFSTIRKRISTIEKALKHQQSALFKVKSKNN